MVVWRRANQLTYKVRALKAGFEVSPDDTKAAGVGRKVNKVPGRSSLNGDSNASALSGAGAFVWNLQHEVFIRKKNGDRQVSVADLNAYGIVNIIRAGLYSAGRRLRLRRNCKEQNKRAYDSEDRLCHGSSSMPCLGRFR